VRWEVAQSCGMFYVDGFSETGKRRIVASFPRRDEDHARRTAEALNILDALAETPPGWDDEVAAAWDRVSGVHVQLRPTTNIEAIQRELYP
jgi:hypothetical protein